MSTSFEARDPEWEAKLRDSFRRQTIMGLLGARLGNLEPGLCEIEVGFREDLCQQHGFIHAGVLATIADSAGGYACYSLMSPGSAILSVEFKMNQLRPAEGEFFVAQGRVVKPGRRLFFAEMSVYGVSGERRVLCATGQQTNMRLEPEADGLPEG